MPANNPAAYLDPNYGTNLAQSITPQVPTSGPPQTAVPGLGGAPRQTQNEEDAANTKLGWPDALVGLSNFIAATKRQRPTPGAPSLAGIGQPAPQGNVGQGPRGRTTALPGALAQFL